MNHHVDYLLHFTSVVLLHGLCDGARDLLDRLLRLSSLQVVIVLLLLLQRFLYELGRLVQQNGLFLLRPFCLLAGLGRSVELLHDFILAVFDVAVPLEQVPRLQVSEDDFELLVDDAGGHDDLLGVDEVPDGGDLGPEQAGSEHDADVVFAHLVVLGVEDDLPDEAEEEEDRHLVDLRQALDGLHHDLHEVGLGVAGHQHFEQLVGNDGHSQVGKEPLQGVLIRNGLLAIMCGFSIVYRKL